MEKIIVNLAGQSCSGKTYFFKILKKEFPQLLVPRHFTTRRKRADDNGFYLFMDENNYKENLDNVIVCSGTKNHHYGILRPRASSNMLLISSLKDIFSLNIYREKNNFRMLNFIFYDTNLEKTIFESHRYTVKEANYRLHENTRDFAILLNNIEKVASLNNKFIFFDKELVTKRTEEKILKLTKEFGYGKNIDII